MTTYTLCVPSGVLRKDGVDFPSDDRDPDYQQYYLWLAAGNGPAIVYDPVAAPPAVNAQQIAAAMDQLGLDQASPAQLANDVFNVAVTL